MRILPHLNTQHISLFWLIAYIYQCGPADALLLPDRQIRLQDQHPGRRIRSAHHRHSPHHLLRPPAGQRLHVRRRHPALPLLRLPFLSDILSNQYAWVWFFWMLSQAWITIGAPRPTVWIRIITKSRRTSFSKTHLN